MKRAAITVACAAGMLVAGFAGTQLSAQASSTNLALYHDGWSSYYRSPFGAAATGSKITLRLRTSASVTKVTMFVTNTTGKTFATLAMGRILHKSGIDVWSARVTAPSTTGSLHYWFKAQAGSVTRFYGDTDSTDNGVGTTYSSDTYLIPFRINIYLKSFTTPSWMDNAVVYQIFPDRFYDGNTDNDALEATGTKYGYITTQFHSNWSDTPDDGPPYSSDFFGGDLQGVIDKLPYLKNLGVTVIYLNPIFLSPSDHKYDTSNFKEIDPEFGTLQTFQTLVADAKADGMHLILDGVFEDTSSDSIYFDKYGTFAGDPAGPGACDSTTSAYYSWYTWTNGAGGDPSRCTNDQYNGWFNLDTIPLVKDNASSENFFFRKPDSVAQYWLSQGIGGWRLDSADTLPMKYWRAFRTVIKSAYPDSVIIGEKNGWSDALPWLLGDQWDGIMNYQFRDGVLGFLANGRDTANGSGALTATEFLDNEMGLLAEYPRPAIMSSMNLIDSHDTARILNDLNFSQKAEKLAAFFQMTWLGAPTVLYGDETGITGSDGNTARATFPWSSQNTALENYYTGIIAMRHTYPALYQGTVSPLLSSNSQRVVVFQRQSSSQNIVVALNDSNKAQTVTVPVTLASGSTLTGINPGNTATTTVAKGTIKLTIPAQSGEAFLVGKG